MNIFYHIFSRKPEYSLKETREYVENPARDSSIRSPVIQRLLDSGQAVKYRESICILTELPKRLTPRST